MKVLKVLAILFVGLILLVVVAGLLLPKDYELTREVTIDASPAEVHVLVGDLNRWPEWAPWKEMDPSVDVTIVKPTGVGAHQTWTSDTGGGKLTFTKSDPATGIEYDMAFMEGETEMPADVVMKYETTADGTKVIWTMSGEMEGFVGGFFALAMPAMVGGSFDNGLNKLKAGVEAAKAGDSAE